MSKKEKRRLKEAQKQNQMEEEDEEEEKIEEQSSLSIFKQKVVALLKDNEFESVRSKKMSVDDFLKLLFIFNQAGIRFN